MAIEFKNLAGLAPKWGYGFFYYWSHREDNKSYNNRRNDQYDKFSHGILLDFLK
jgi:hypothetical protein